MTFPFLHYKRGPLLSTRIGTSFHILLINWPIFDKYILLTAEDRFLVRINALLNGRVLSVQIYQKKIFANTLGDSWGLSKSYGLRTKTLNFQR